MPGNRWSLMVVISLLALVSLVPVSFINLGSSALSFIISGIFIAGMIFLFFASIRREHTVHSDDWWLIALVCVWGCEIAFAPAKLNSMSCLSKFMVKGILLLFVMPRIIRNQKQIHYVLQCVIVIAALVAGMGLIEYYYDKNIVYQQLYSKYNIYYIMLKDRGGMVSSIGHPVPFASYLLLCLPITWYFYFRSLKKIYIFTSLIFAGAIVLSLSRSSMCIMALLLVAAPFVYLHNKLKFLGLIALLVMMVGIGFRYIPKFQLYSSYRFSERVLKKDFTKSQRFYSYQTTTQIVKEHPFVGLGFGNYPLFYRVYQDRLPVSFAMNWETPDNMYLRIAAETGLLGFVMFILFLARFAKKMYAAYLAMHDDNKMLMLSLGLSCVAFLINILVFDGFLWLAPNFLFCCIGGIMLAHVRLQE